MEYAFIKMWYCLKKGMIKEKFATRLYTCQIGGRKVHVQEIEKPIKIFRTPKMTVITAFWSSPTNLENRLKYHLWSSRTLTPRKLISVTWNIRHNANKIPIRYCKSEVGSTITFLTTSTIGIWSGLTEFNIDSILVLSSFRENYNQGFVKRTMYPIIGHSKRNCEKETAILRPPRHLIQHSNIYMIVSAKFK